MKAGIPLTQEDRDVWLESLGTHLVEIIKAHNRRDAEMQKHTALPESLIGTPREVPEGQKAYEEGLSKSLSRFATENDNSKYNNNNDTNTNATNNNNNVGSNNNNGKDDDDDTNSTFDNYGTSRSQSLVKDSEKLTPTGAVPTGSARVARPDTLSKLNQSDRLSQKAKLSKAKNSLLKCYIKSTVEGLETKLSASSASSISPAASATSPSSASSSSASSSSAKPLSLDFGGDRYNCVVCTCSALTELLRKQLFNIIHDAYGDIRVVYLFIYPDDNEDNLVDKTERNPETDEVLANAVDHHDYVPLRKPTADFIKKRMDERARATGHFMGSNMLQSQLDLMCLPTKSERQLPSEDKPSLFNYVANAFALTPSKTPKQLVDEMIEYLELKFLL